jgi:putative transposase
MDTNNIVDFASRDGISDALTDLLRTGAQQLSVIRIRKKSYD